MKRKFSDGSTQKKKRKVSEGEEDRISNLPNEMIDHIFDYLPIRDAARTTILSKQWRHVWPMYPKLIFDKHCFKSNSRGKFMFYEIITKILFQHKGPILEFFLDLVCIPSSRFSYVDQWLVFLSLTAGVKKVSLVDSSPHASYYSYGMTLMPDVISCSSLEHLELKNVHISTSNRSLSNLTSLSCEKMFFIPKQSIDTFKDSLLNPNLRELNFSLGWELSKRKDFDLSSLLERVPKIVILRFDSYALKFLGAGTGLIPRTMEHLEHLTLDGLDIKDLDQVSAFVCLLQSCPNLRTLNLKVLSSSKVVGKGAPNCLKALQCKKAKLNLIKLKTVKIILNPKSISERILLELLLSCSPSLDDFVIKTKLVEATKELLRSSPELLNANNLRLVWTRKRKRKTGKRKRKIRQ